MLKVCVISAYSLNLICPLDCSLMPMCNPGEPIAPLNEPLSLDTFLSVYTLRAIGLIYFLTYLTLALSPNLDEFSPSCYIMVKYILSKEKL